MYAFKTSLVLLILGLAALLGAPRNAEAQLVEMGRDNASLHFVDYWLEANRALLRQEAVTNIRAGTVRPSDRTVFDGGPVRYGLVSAANASRIVTAAELLCINRENGSLVLGCRMSDGRTVHLRPSAYTCARSPTIARLLPRGCTNPFTSTVEDRMVLIRRAEQRELQSPPPTQVMAEREIETPPRALDPPPQALPGAQPESGPPLRADPRPAMNAENGSSFWSWLTIIVLTIAGLLTLWWFAVRPRLQRRLMDSLVQRNSQLQTDVERLTSELRSERSRKPTQPLPGKERPTDLLQRIESLKLENDQLTDQRDAEQAAAMLLGEELKDSKRRELALTSERDAALTRAEQAELALSKATTQPNLQPAPRPMRASTPPQVRLPFPPATTAAPRVLPTDSDVPNGSGLPPWSAPGAPPPGTIPMPASDLSNGSFRSTAPPARPPAASGDNPSEIRQTYPMISTQAGNVVSEVATPTQPAGSLEPARVARTTLAGVGESDRVDGGDETAFFDAGRFAGLTNEPRASNHPSYLRGPTEKIRPGLMQQMGAHSIDRAHVPSEAPPALSAVPGTTSDAPIDSIVPPAPRMPNIGDPDGQDDGPVETSGARRVG